METHIGSVLLTASQPIAGSLTPEMVITEVCKFLSQLGIITDYNAQYSMSLDGPTKQEGSSRLEWRVEFKMDRAGTLGLPVDITPDSNEESEQYMKNSFGAYPKYGWPYGPKYGV